MEELHQEAAVAPSPRNVAFLAHATSVNARRFVVSCNSFTPYYPNGLGISVRISETSDFTGDSGEMPDNRCSHCVQFGFECQHKEVTKTLGSAKGYVESLEARLEKMDRLFAKLLPGIDINQEIERIETPEYSEPEFLAPNDAEYSTSMFTMQLRRLNLNPEQNRFVGKASSYQLVQTALDLKQEYTGEHTKPGVTPHLALKRHEFWDVPPWMSSHPGREQDWPAYIYPDEDLIPSLIEAYFEQINHFLPLLHRQTFEKSVADGLHFTDPMFGATLLLVCAHGARYSNDPRVLAEGYDSPRSAGWKWFEQVDVLRKSLFKRATLYELQMHALYVSFAQSSEKPQGIWAEIGLAVRLSQEVGAHRRRRKQASLPTVEDELWKRVFWVILTLDRNISAFQGRPCGLQDEDFDLDLPLECDDEFWEDGFQQPPGKPSSIAFFNCYLRLLDILAYAMRLIYSIKRPNTVYGKTTPRSDQQVIVELDTAMNHWMDSVPSHLKWNPNCDNQLFLKQSAALYATYYHVQGFIHRPFIPSPRNPHPIAFPSLAICTNAARSCCHVLESFTRLSALPLAHLQNTAFTAAVILLLNIWSGKRSGYAPNPRREMEDVQRCMAILKASEQRCASAGRYRDILIELAFAGDVSIPTTPAPIALLRKKRLREDEGDHSSPVSTASSPPLSPIEGSSRSIAGSRRVSMSRQTQPQPRQPALFSLPMYGNELGRLPIYGQFTFTDSNEGPAPLPSSSSLPNALETSPTNLDQIILTDLPSAPGDGLPTAGMDAYVLDGLFNGQTMQTFANDRLNNQSQQQQQSSTAADFASLFAGSFSDFEGFGRFGTMPAMDNDTMTMWSTAPTGLELDDWRLYLSSVEQITQAQGFGPAPGPP